MTNDVHFSFATELRSYEFDLKATSGGPDTISIGNVHYALAPKNEVEREAITNILKEALSSKPNSIEDLSHKLKGLSTLTHVNSSPASRAHQVAVPSIIGPKPQMRRGNTIVLVGTSSAGKTNIISAIREFEPERVELGSDKTGAEYIYEFMENTYSRHGISKADWEHLHQVLVPRDENFHIHDAVDDDGFQFRPGVSQEDQARARKTASLLRGPVHDLLKSMPHVDDIVMDKILDLSKKGTDSVFDILDIDKVKKHPIGEETKVKAVLVYCPFHNLSERLARRNDLAIKSGNFENVRAGVFPLLQFAEIFGPKKPGDTDSDVVDIVSKKMVEDDFDLNFNAMVEDLKRRDPAGLKKMQQDGSLDERRVKEKNALLEALGFRDQDPSLKTVELTPRRKYDFKINSSDPSLGSSIEDKGRNAAKIILNK